jgi:hypothetical protein
MPNDSNYFLILLSISRYDLAGFTRRYPCALKPPSIKSKSIWRNNIGNWPLGCNRKAMVEENYDHFISKCFLHWMIIFKQSYVTKFFLSMIVKSMSMTIMFLVKIIAKQNYHLQCNVAIFCQIFRLLSHHRMSRVFWNAAQITIPTRCHIEETMTRTLMLYANWLCTVCEKS